MHTSHYSLEDPVEVAIGPVAQVSTFAEKTQEPLSATLPGQPYCVEGFLAGVGAVIAYERADGSMALSCWKGEDIQVWARFDVSQLPQMIYMRQHMVEAVPIEQPRPPGFIKVTCFKRKQC